jgi:ubiquinone/menaquinone biosynthesis C-methylase UbiE
MSRQRSLIPAAGFTWLTPLYDAAIALLVRERSWREALVAEIDPLPGERIVDVGCGTGSLAVMLKRACPEAEIVGADPHPEMLMRAQRKAEHAGCEIAFHEGFADELTRLPGLGPETSDKVVTSLMLHHLLPEAKRAALAEMLRIVRPGGRLHVADWGAPSNALMRVLFLPVQLLDGFATTEDNRRGLLPAMIREAGFEHVEETHRFATALGTLSLLRARRPARSR